MLMPKGWADSQAGCPRDGSGRLLWLVADKKIWALVSPAHRDLIKRACDENAALRDIHWFFPEVKAWPLKQAVEPNWERTYNLLWQRAALHEARELQRQIDFNKSIISRGPAFAHQRSWELLKPRLL